MPAIQVSFSSDSQQKIHGTLELPADAQPKQFALLVHCLLPGATVQQLVYALTQDGFGVLHLHPQEIQGRFVLIDQPTLLAAARFLSDNHQPVSLLIGHSLAGTTALLAASAIESLRALVTIGTPIDPDKIGSLGSGQTDPEEPITTVTLGDHTYQISRTWLDALHAAYAGAAFKKIRKPLLILHAVADRVVAIHHAADVFQHTLHPKSFVSLDQADHWLSLESDARYAGRMIATWVLHYIDTYTRSQLTSDKQVVTQTRKTFTTQIVADQHTLIADEPESVGGHDLGPDPYDLLAASLGACTGMTLRMYADHKQWPLQEVRVHLQHQKIYAEDCSECDDQQSKIDHIERIIELEGPLDEAQKKRLVEIANKCPVHKTLSTRPKIVTTFREKQTDF